MIQNIMFRIRKLKINMSKNLKVFRLEIIVIFFRKTCFKLLEKNNNLYFTERKEFTKLFLSKKRILFV